jgi:hypothetical protein
VPFGPRAAHAALVNESHCAPISADDFWGEGSAAIHDVLQAPSPDRGARSPGDELPARKSRRSSLALGTIRAHLSILGRVRLRTRTRLSVAATVLTTACAAVLLPQLESGPTVSAGLSPRADSMVLDESASGLTSALAHAKASALNLAHRQTGTARTPSQGAHVRRSSRRGALPRSAGSTSKASYSRPPQGVPVSTQSDVASGGSASSAGGSSQPAAVASSATSPASRAAGPTGPGAAFGPGHLG